ncbi:hypothetical protein F4780DRAFT_404962 [Xylariomycetidae sp. FL0641]|nr:hypothetical protein F4780DRAFT_404962 [Xylariomycetidae sp. FL0641]
MPKTAKGLRVPHSVWWWFAPGVACLRTIAMPVATSTRYGLDHIGLQRLLTSNAHEIQESLQCCREQNTYCLDCLGVAAQCHSGQRPEIQHWWCAPPQCQCLRGACTGRRHKRTPPRTCPGLM